MFAPSPPSTNTFCAPGLSHQCQYSYNYRYAPMQSSPLAMSSSSSSNPFATQQQQQQPAFNFQPQLQPQSQTQPQPQAQSQGQNQSYYAARYANTIANPLASRRTGNAAAVGTGRGKTNGATSPEARAHRRTLFLNRIKEGRDAGRFEARGEQFVLMEDMAEEKRRREAMERRAERIMTGFGIEEERGFNLDEGMFFFKGSGWVSSGC